MSEANSTDGNDPAAGSTGGDTGSTGGETEPEAKFTQADVDRIVAERAARAERAALAGVTDALGGRKPEEAAKALTELEELRKANMDEADRLTLEAKEAMTRAEAREAEADAVAQEAVVRTALLTPVGEAGTVVNPGNIGDAAVLVQTTMAANEGMTVDEAVADVAKRVPALFAGSSGSQSTPTPNPGRPAGERRGAGEQGADDRAKGLIETFLARDRGREAPTR